MGNFDNDTIKNKKFVNFGLMISYLNININNTQEYPILKLLLAIINYKNKSNDNNTNF